MVLLAREATQGPKVGNGWGNKRVLREQKQGPTKVSLYFNIRRGLRRKYRNLFQRPCSDSLAARGATKRPVEPERLRGVCKRDPLLATCRALLVLHLSRAVSPYSANGLCVDRWPPRVDSAMQLRERRWQQTSPVWPVRERCLNTFLTFPKQKGVAGY